ncbi:MULTISPECIES: bifunctional 4-hydroxy-2-oxoglutarate aldolase/2-dehydro-3-deoxy-phosphogluconate aldolase [Sporosarcina]|uniref:bifunctional 4-hydroxy-2-oxoglutarate aldolase/2-dehydro-3-deoxy-phosphogluconate aldolase n=1 Tax=Sporosarcina TaxID=1569 RepID=UPI00129A7C73|nr:MULTISPECIES: bifunctional 4-hydroxy-2-oxoglutarate aldolase/2-dehydro-3-deoxy-phosphogluconate aldolase [Sporosarcina]GKV66568.1 bifunctional 2-keto-4-hydroxyglutarate aldolase/2-keto-3-deoxy-6-phosphogluconate aldolase [Sporosarcina sp. NCCP-2331]GLB56845.1 bifunctional 2-keto-4-hydroxyglutarate aldolase/2-keto-3-deoxy-6-phosphogluconate aldolase [Sporosarcina sp. NCCP-2378]
MDSVIKSIEEQRVVAVIRADTAEEAIAIIEGAVAGGISLIELTYTTPDVAEIYEKTRHLSFTFGAGTVNDIETAKEAVELGAGFIVSPYFDPEVADYCMNVQIPYFPGCMTVKEMMIAKKAGAPIIKLFPANHFDSSFIKAVKGPLPDVKIMPTGGIGLHNLSEWLQAGAIAVGIGSDLNKAYAEGGVAAVTDISKKYTRLVKGVQV